MNVADNQGELKELLGWEKNICVRTIISGYRKIVVKKRQEKTTH